MAGISSLGIGSGILTTELVEKLAKAEREPVEKRLQLREDSVNAKLSDFGRIQSAVTELRLFARNLGTASTLAAKNATSSHSGISVSASNSATPAQYSVNVDNLAQAHSITSGLMSDKDQTGLGSGSLTIKSGSKQATIEIDSSNNTLQGIAKAINSAKVGVTASIVNTGNGYQLVLSSENTGTANAIEITVDDNDGDDLDGNGLSQLAFNSQAKNLNEVMAAEDAIFSVNGISVTRSSNTISDLIDGVTFTLSAETSSPATIKIARDTEAVAGRVQEFVDKYNELQKIINEVTVYNPGGDSGSLVGHSGVRTIQSQMRALLGAVIPGLENASVRTLSEVGISTNAQTGLLEFNASKFQQALADHEDDVVALFAEQGRTSDSQIEFVRSGTNTKVGTYAIEITQLATRGQFIGGKDLSGGAVIDSDNSFKIKVDGVESNSISLTEKTYADAAELMEEIQNQINADAKLKAAGVTVQVSLDENNQLVFTSSKFGSSSKVEFSEGGAVLEALGLDTGTSVTGLDVAGTINGKEAKGSGQILSAASGDDSEGIQVRVTGGAVGSRGTVSFIEGVGDRLVNLINGFLSEDGVIYATNDSFSEQLKSIATERMKLDDRINSLIARLSKQFTAADILISQLQNTGDYITQQMEALIGASKKR